jgi:hypothetical protein
LGGTDIPVCARTDRNVGATPRIRLEAALERAELILSRSVSEEPNLAYAAG